MLVEFRSWDQDSTQRAQYLQNVGSSTLVKCIKASKKKCEFSNRQSEQPKTSGVRTFVFCTDGPMDLQGFLRPECRRKGLQLRNCWQNYIDVKKLVTNVLKTFDLTKQIPVKSDVLQMLAIKQLNLWHESLSPGRALAKSSVRRSAVCRRC